MHGHPLDARGGDPAGERAREARGNARGRRLHLHVRDGEGVSVHTRRSQHPVHFLRDIGDQSRRCLFRVCVPAGDFGEDFRRNREVLRENSLTLGYFTKAPRGRCEGGYLLGPR